MRTNSKLGLAATALMMMAGVRAIGESMPAPRKGSNRDYKPSRTKQPDTALAREIAEHNAEVDRKKAEKKARKRG